MINCTAKTPLLLRAIAKAIDLFLALAIARLISDIGIYGSVLYIAISDGLFEGSSIGKKIIGLKVIAYEDASVASFRHSIIRNAILCITLFLTIMPIIGWIVLIALLLFEAILIIGSPEGRHLGDELAGTVVIVQKTTQN